MLGDVTTLSVRATDVHHSRFDAISLVLSEPVVCSCPLERDKFCERHGRARVENKAGATLVTLGVASPCVENRGLDLAVATILAVRQQLSVRHR
jgi:hypothetical protein